MKYLQSGAILVGTTILVILLAKKRIKGIPASLVPLIGASLFAVAL
ncbi:hypothetical protein [Bacillus sp. 2205SS5-2]